MNTKFANRGLPNGPKPLIPYNWRVGQGLSFILALAGCGGGSSLNTLGPEVETSTDTSGEVSTSTDAALLPPDPAIQAALSQSTFIDPKVLAPLIKAEAGQKLAQLSGQRSDPTRQDLVLAISPLASPLPSPTPPPPTPTPLPTPTPNPNLTILHAFSSESYYPYAGPTVGRDGLIYGTTAYGGSNGTGVIYQSGFGTFQTLYPFGYNKGAYPGQSPMVQVTNGNFLGTTYSGGNFGQGVLFRVTPSGDYKVLKHFNGSNGAGPVAGIMQATNGLIYGTTNGGGNSGFGTVFSYDLSNGSFNKLTNFNFSNGAYPNGRLVQASNGLLYGVTYRGGRFGCGVIYSINPNSNAFQKRLDLKLGVACQSETTLVQASDGSLLGIAYKGGSFSDGYGTIFRYNPVTNDIQKIHNFNYTQGAYPASGVVLHPNGNFYGGTTGGGRFGCGVLYSISMTGTYKVINNFDCYNGDQVWGNVAVNQTGELIGTTLFGGSNFSGTLFKFIP